MKTKVLIILAIMATMLGISQAGTVQATDTYSCPPGTTHDYKIEPLSGKTFEVPTPPSGWVITAVILKIGGGGNDEDVHVTFSPVTPGQILSVAYQQHDISHAHICKGEAPPPTTEEPPDDPPPTTQPPTTTETTQPPTTTEIIDPPASTFPPESPPQTPPTTTPLVPAVPIEPTCADQGLFPQGPTGNEPCGPEDLCSGDGTTTNWRMAPCPTTTTTVAVSGTLPSTGADDPGTLAAIAALVLIGGSGLGLLARRRS